MQRSGVGSKLVGEPGAFPALDGLRAIAILLVLARHASLPFEAGISDSIAGAQGFIWSVLRNGWLGVDLFFVLSGFLIARTLDRERLKGWNHGFPSAYLKKRILRTFPLYYAIIVICTLGVIPGYSVTVERPLYEIAVHALFLQDYLGTNILVPLWSLATEEKFYLLAPFLVAFIWRVDNAWARMGVLAMLLLASVGARALNWALQSPDSYSAFFWQVRAPFHGCLDGLLVGVISFEVSRIPILRRTLCRTALPVLIASMTLVVLILSADEWARPGAMAATLLVIPAFSMCCGTMLLASLNITGKALTILGSRSLRFVARHSYAVYLTHYTTLGLSLEWSHQISGDTDTFVPLFVLLYLFLSFAFAIALHFAVERPFLKIKAKIP